jgi:hypothetical protein
MPPVISGRVRKSDPKQSASKSNARTKEERIEQRRAKAAEDQLEWENQYLKGKPAAYFAGYDREVIPNTSPFVQVASPFKGLGKIEFTAETDEPGWDFFRLSRGEKSNPNHHVFVVPHQHIGKAGCYSTSHGTCLAHVSQNESSSSRPFQMELSSGLS